MGDNVPYWEQSHKSHDYRVSAPHYRRVLPVKVYPQVAFAHRRVFRLSVFRQHLPLPFIQPLPLCIHGPVDCVVALIFGISAPVHKQTKTGYLSHCVAHGLVVSLKQYCPVVRPLYHSHAVTPIYFVTSRNCSTMFCFLPIIRNISITVDIGGQSAVITDKRQIIDRLLRTCGLSARPTISYFYCAHLPADAAQVFSSPASNESYTLLASESGHLTLCLLGRARPCFV